MDMKKQNMENSFNSQYQSVMLRKADEQLLVIKNAPIGDYNADAVKAAEQEIQRRKDIVKKLSELSEEALIDFLNQKHEPIDLENIRAEIQKRNWNTSRIINQLKSHIYNEHLKRLEPTDSKCMFCNNGYSQNMDDNVFIPLFKENDRTNVIVYCSVEFSKISVGASTCPNCNKIHHTAELFSFLLVIGIIICIVGLMYLLIDSIGVIGLIGVGLGTSLLLLLIGAPLLRKIFLKQKGILNWQDGLKKYKIVQYLLFDGWTFNQPTA